MTELDDARWFTRAEVAAALAGDPARAFLAPPRFAIAHTLLERWLDRLEVTPCAAVKGCANSPSWHGRTGFHARP